MKTIGRAILLLALLLCTLRGFSQVTTNKGTEFWTAYMQHQRGIPGSNVFGGPSRMRLYITSDVSTSGKVEIADNSFAPISYNVQANNVTTIDVPYESYVPNQGNSLKGIHITSLKPIAVYAHIYAETASGATLLLPVSTLGKDYMSINYKQVSNADTDNNNPVTSNFNIIGVEDDTQVEITLSAPLFDNSRAAGQPYIITLKKGEVYQARSFADLTGTHIRSISTNNQPCKKIAVFSGSSKIMIGCGRGNDSSDNLFQQVYPTVTWGKSYITVPLKGRNYDIYRVVLSGADTKVTINGQLITPALGEKYIEFKNNQVNIISADKPIQVVQYAVSQGQSINCSDIAVPDDEGDPEMIYLNPLEQTIDKVTLYSTKEFKIVNNFINVVIKTAAVPSFKLDGVSFTQFQPIAGTTYSYAQVSVLEGSHTIQAADGFNAIAYGFGRFESYGYAAGTNLRNLEKNVTLSEIGGTKTFINGCTGISYKLKLVLPYQTNRIVWKLADGDVKPAVINPAFTTFDQNGKTLYAYEYAQPVAYNAPDNYSVSATVTNPTAAGCEVTEEILFNFEVNDMPAADFKVDNLCSDQPALFTDLSDAKGGTIQAWTWDFDDGTPVETNNINTAQHSFARPGDYTVTLTVTTASGCTNQTQKKITIFKTPEISFTTSATLCLGEEIAFNGSSPQAANIKTWTWNFGDNSPTVTGKNATHTYTQTGSYPVILTIESLDGCVREITSTIIIRPLPNVDFDMTDICVADQFAEFTDKSTIEDNTETDFTYNWNFGDNASASPGNPNTATGKTNIRHRYTRAGTYTVTLTVNSKYGCPTMLSKELVVNGNQFAGDIEVMDATKLCSDRAVVFRNNVTVDGNITKVEWYFDYDNDPSAMQTITRADLAANSELTHQYAFFNTAGTKSYHVRMVAYSGQSCFREYNKTVIINATPKRDLPQSGMAVCLNDAPFALTENKNGFTGNGRFIGAGVAANSANLFDPAKAGPGEHELRYEFISPTTGCTFEMPFKITVNPVPIVSLQQKYIIFQGDEVTLNASATGTGLTYRWSPGLGLNTITALQPQASPPEDTRYRLDVTASTGCVTTVYVDVEVLRKIVIPNTFSPNDDGINDAWVIKYIEEYPNCVVTVFSRYGQKLYTSMGYNVPWNGTQNNNKLPAGTYYYSIDLKDGRKPVAGFVTLLK